MRNYSPGKYNETQNKSYTYRIVSPKIFQEIKKGLTRVYNYNMVDATEVVCMKCATCGNEFEAARATAKFCSVRCKNSFHRVLSVSETSVSVSNEVSVSPLSVSESDEDVGTPARVVDLERDLGLNLEKDFGIYSWTADGIFIRPEIRVSQVHNIARLVHAKHGRECPEFRANI
jgi:hypothetical protein